MGDESRAVGVTEIKKIPNRGRSLTTDSGGREVAETVLQFVKRFVEPQRLKRGRVAVPARR